MVELAQFPGANIAAIAREHGFNHNLLFKWLRLWRSEGRVSRVRKTYNKAPAPTGRTHSASTYRCHAHPCAS
ncbi:transposase [Yersinia ruckeri]|nr:transposase [Yersinia ruckeri]